MNLQEYRWFRNPRGLHNLGVFKPLNADRYIRPKMGWAKMVAAGTEYAEPARQLIQHECMSIVRVFRENMGAMHPGEDFYAIYQAYINVGALWFELYNEPNLEGEWPQDSNGPAVYVDWANREECVEPMMDNWIEWAVRLCQMGAYPGFPAMADTADHRHATIHWLDEFLKYLKEAHYDETMYVINNGMWCATHPYIANHFYQEPPGGPSHVARSHTEERAYEPGWHFEYPFDPLQQNNDPGRTVFGGTPLTPYGDPNGLIAAGWAFQELLKRHFNAGPVPVVGTEGGIWRIPARNDPPHIIDDRYPGYTWLSHPEATMAMFKWMAEQAPPWFFGLTLWGEGDYYEVHGGKVLAIERMETDPVYYKDVPSIDTNSGLGGFGEPGDVEPDTDTDVITGPEIVVVGPGPVVGQPDYHWLILAPGLQADWFFQAAKRYWQAFRPTVLTDWNTIQLLPGTKSLAVTVLARSDTVDYMNQVIRDAWPNVYYDPLVYDNLNQMKAELDRRATEQRRFG